MEVKRFLLLNKRLFLKKSYIVLLLMVPLLVIFLRQIGKKDDGIVTMGLCKCGIEDAATDELFASFLEEQPEITVTEFADKEEALRAVKDGTVNAVWIVERPLSAILETVSEGTFGRRTEDSVFLTVAIKERAVEVTFISELLNCSIYRYTSYAAYEGEVRAHTLRAWTDEKLKSLYDSQVYPRTFVESYYLDGQSGAGSNYDIMVMPMRGMLGLWLFILGMVAALYYQEDEQKGLFVWWKDHVILREAGYILQILLNGGVIYLLSLLAAGVFTTLLSELLQLSVYIVSILLYAMVLRRICKNGIILSMTTPLLILANIVYCPIFLYVRVFRGIKRLFPLYYYLNSTHDPYFTGQLALFCLSLLMVILLWEGALCLILKGRLTIREEKKVCDP